MRQPGRPGTMFFELAWRVDAADAAATAETEVGGELPFKDAQEARTSGDVMVAFKSSVAGA